MLEKGNMCQSSVGNIDNAAAHRVLLNRRSLTPVQSDVHKIDEVGNEGLPLVSADVGRRSRWARLVLDRSTYL
jgi:hypothetical protein